MTTKYIFIIVLTVITLLNSCKKKDSTPDEPINTTSTTGNTVTSSRTMSATVNGSSWSMANGTSNAASSISQSGNLFTFEGRTAFSAPYTSIRIAFTYTTGVVSLSSSYPYYANYIDANNTTFYATGGTLNIISIDTTGSGPIKKLKANYSFTTGVISSQSYTVTNGLIDYAQ